MNENIKMWLKVVAVMLLAMVAIVSNAGVWNANHEGFVIGCSIVNFIAEGVGLYFFSKKVLFKKDEKGNDNR